MTKLLARVVTQGYQSQEVFDLIGMSISLRYNG